MRETFSAAKLFLFLSLTFLFSYAFAQDVLAPQDFFAQVLEFIKSFGGLPQMAKIAGAILLILASFKVSFLNDLIWSKLGSFKVWAAPILGLAAGILGIGAGGQPITGAAIFAYVTAGAGAVILHELLDTIKAIPGIGQIWVTVINLIEGMLGGPASKQLK